MPTIKAFAGVVASLLLIASAQASTLQIDAKVSGCGQCAGGPVSVPVGTVLTAPLIDPVQADFAAGTYTITNAATTGYYSAWNFSGGWVWSYGIVDDATKTILSVGYVGGDVRGAQADVATETNVPTYDGTTLLSATSTAGFTDTLTLAKASKLDFFVIDYYAPDNDGGVALNLQSPTTMNPGPVSVPEPSSLLMAVPLLALGLLSFRRPRTRSIRR